MKMDEMHLEHCGHRIGHFSWAAVFVGALVGVGLGFLLNLFSMAIGLSAYSSTPSGASVIAIGGLIGLLIGVIVSMGAAGFVTGVIASCHHQCMGVVYGFVTWSIALLFSALLLMPLSHYVAFSEDSLNPTTMMTEVSKNTGTTNNISVEKNKVADAVKQQATPTHLAWSGWIVFGLFFIGALSSCIGACCGMGCKKDREDEYVRTPRRTSRTSL